MGNRCRIALNLRFFDRGCCQRATAAEPAMISVKTMTSLKIDG